MSQTLFSGNKSMVNIVSLIAEDFLSMCDCHPLTIFSVIQEQWKLSIDNVISKESGVILLFFLMVTLYVYKGCPYLARISLAICCLSCTVMLLGPQNTNAHNCSSSNTKRYDEILQVLASMYFLTGSVIAFLSVSLKPYVWDHLNSFKDLEELGFEHLRETARTRKRIITSLAKEILQKRDLSKLPPVFPNGWIPILESRSLVAGQVKPVLALGREFAVFRGENKKCFVFDAFCPHLGANIAAAGVVRGNCIECRFHGWQFRGEDGACINIPYSDKVPDLARAKKWTSCETNGMIYVWFHAEEMPPSWEMTELPNINNGSWLYRGRGERVVMSHIQEFHENGSDLSHFDQVHSPMTAIGSWLNCYLEWLWKRVKYEWKIKWETGSPPNTNIAYISINSEIIFYGYKVPFSKFKTEIRVVGPATVQMEVDCFLGKFVTVLSTIPEEPLKQRVIMQIYTEPSVKQWWSNLILCGEIGMVERDFVIWNNKIFLKNPLFLKEDKTIKSFRRWYSAFYSENSPKLSDFRKNSLDW